MEAFMEAEVLHTVVVEEDFLVEDSQEAEDFPVEEEAREVSRKQNELNILINSKVLEENSTPWSLIFSKLI